MLVNSLKNLPILKKKYKIRNGIYFLKKDFYCEGKKMIFRDRRDGKLIRDIDGMHYAMPLMYPNRCDNEAFLSMEIDLENPELME